MQAPAQNPIPLSILLFQQSILEGIGILPQLQDTGATGIKLACFPLAFKIYGELVRHSHDRLSARPWL